MEVFSELIYADREVQNIIKKEYPEAHISDASDCVHEERFEVKIKDVDEMDFYIFAAKEKFIMECFKFQLMLGGMTEEHKKFCKELMEKLKELGIVSKKGEKDDQDNT